MFIDNEVNERGRGITRSEHRTFLASQAQKTVNARLRQRSEKSQRFDPSVLSFPLKLSYTSPFPLDPWNSDLVILPSRFFLKTGPELSDMHVNTTYRKVPDGSTLAAELLSSSGSGSA
jgi:hypothetical protein